GGLQDMNSKTMNGRTYRCVMLSVIRDLTGKEVDVGLSDRRDKPLRVAIHVGRRARCMCGPDWVLDFDANSASHAGLTQHNVNTSSMRQSAQILDMIFSPSHSVV
nr:hypothetical protein [Tanacetum cinerariifolium]